MFQRTSLYWELSELSPVWMASASGLPVTGPTPIALISRTIASAIWPGEHLLGAVGRAEEPVGGSGEGSSSRSMNSSRSGDWASTMCTSLSCANAITGARAAGRPGAASARGRCGRRCASAGPGTTGR